MSHSFVASAILVLSLVTRGVSSAQHSSIPPGVSHDEHLTQVQKEAEMKRRANAAMGFDQDKTTHHFTKTANGGLIQVEVNDQADRAERDLIRTIRTHLREIAREFANGVFEKPVSTHAEVPPGVAVMQRLKGAVTYAFEETATGGRVRISTRNVEALEAIHAFLTYQVVEHRTGDPLSIVH